MPPPRAVLSTPSAQRRSSVRARPGMPRTTWACSVLRPSSSTRPAVRIVRAPVARGDGRGVGAPEGAGLLEGRADLAYDLVVVDVARGGDHQVGGVVVLLVEAADAVAVERVDRVDGAEDRAAEGVSPNMVCANRSCTQSPGSSSVIAISSRIDAALGVDVLLDDQRAGQHVADDVDGERQVGVEHARVVARVLLRRERVHLAADRVDRGGDVERACAGRCP